MDLGTVRHRTLPGLNSTLTPDTWDSGTTLLAQSQARRGTFVYPVREILSGKISPCWFPCVASL
ncbi:hypothetical protein Baya_17118 [Bagarius yarrelli]|uniref:Uncharacterized protein n=1 Tax=Bagarius yarrelli TaxID=175774 RepID=A0A556VXH0_BAGYA|nr:hypothetical protein Baya_17118 [Bagarius yarrelli]